jgi:hypothetical protein
MKAMRFILRNTKVWHLRNPPGAIIGIADAGNRFNVENNTLE